LLDIVNELMVSIEMIGSDRAVDTMSKEATIA
jgi:hypothetical protein